MVESAGDGGPSSAAPPAFLITCEHGGNRIPPQYRVLFDSCPGLLDSHRGFDAGALTMARQLAAAFSAPLLASTTSRLLVDLNRSIGHPTLFSAWTLGLPADRRAQILDHYYRPYRTAADLWVEEAVSRGRRVIHLSSHSFTPELDGKVRSADVGLLYDPARSGEAALCARWKLALGIAQPELRVRRNYPYAGKDDGLTAHLRRRFPDDAYIGIELEINQAMVHAAGRRWTRLRTALIDSLRVACGN
jgi:predicted N-formylglutamate amidohydrolase